MSKPTSFFSLFKDMPLPYLCGLVVGMVVMGWAGWKYTARPAAFHTMVGQLDKLLKPSMQDELLRHKISYQSFLSELQSTSGYMARLEFLQKRLKLPDLTRKEVTLLRKLKFAKPKVLAAASLGLLRETMQRLDKELLDVERLREVRGQRWFCADAMSLSKRDCLPSLAATLMVSRFREHYQASLPLWIWPLIPKPWRDKQGNKRSGFGCGVGHRDGFVIKGKKREGRNHWGIDLSEKVGAPLWAMANGTVRKIGLEPHGAGHYITVDSVDGFRYRYFHMKQRTPKQVGESVQVGEFLGYVGRTGASKGAHLHLEIYLRDDNSGKWYRPKDPLARLPLCRY